MAGRVQARYPDDAVRYDAPVEPGIEISPDALDQRAFGVNGDSAWPLAGQGQVVLYGAGRAGDTRDGDLVVTEHDGELVFKRRRDEGAYRIYVCINAEARIPPITVPTDEAPDEYPVVGVITKPRRRSSGRGRPAEGSDCGAT